MPLLNTSIAPLGNGKKKKAKDNAMEFVESIFLNHGPDGKHKKDEAGIVKKYPTMEKGFFYPLKDKDGNIKTDNNGKEKYLPDYEGFCDFMLNEHKLKCNDSLIYKWTGKYYKSISFLNLKHIVKNNVRKGQKPATVNDFYSLSLMHCFADVENIPVKKGFLNCSNGLIDINNNKIYPHNPDNFFKYVLDHKYDTSADCKTFLNSLKLVTNGDKDLQLLIQQVFGYCIAGGDPVAHKAFMFYGEGGNGKSTMLTALANLVGNENAARVPLTLFDKPFSMISLDGKLVNLIDETPKFNINPEAFKNVVSGGYVRASHKGKPEVDLKINARIIFACNKLPNFKDDSDGMMRRLIIIPFNHRISDDQADHNIDEKIKAEMPGVLNFAIEGLKMLIDNGYQFHQAEATTKAFDEFKEETDNVHYFLKERTVFNNYAGGVSFSELYESFKSFCESEGCYYVSKRVFSRSATKYYEKIYALNGLQFCSKDRRLNAQEKGICKMELLVMPFSGITKKHYVQKPYN
jgi:putative DNA primase/helicase